MRDLIRDFFGYLKVHKKYWLAPVFVTLILLAMLAMVSQVATVSFIYTFF